MTGWRIAMPVAEGVDQGHGGHPEPGHLLPLLISQAAAIAALNGPQDFLKERQASFKRRRDLVVSRLNATPGLDCRVPEGAFYTFASCAGVLNKVTPKGKILLSDADFTDYLLEEAHVAVVPGSAFGLSPFFRISYATSKRNW